VRGNNLLAGAPCHWIHGKLSWQPIASWNAEPAVHRMPEETPVGNLDTLQRCLRDG